MTSGHPVYRIRMCDYYTSIIRENDAKLDDRSFVNSLYDQGNLSCPDKFSFEWRLDVLDLGVIDKKDNVLFSIYQGYI